MKYFVEYWRIIENEWDRALYFFPTEQEAKSFATLVTKMLELLAPGDHGYTVEVMPIPSGEPLSLGFSCPPFIHLEDADVDDN